MRWYTGNDVHTYRCRYTKGQRKERVIDSYWIIESKDRYRRIVSKDGQWRIESNDRYRQIESKYRYRQIESNFKYRRIESNFKYRRIESNIEYRRIESKDRYRWKESKDRYSIRIELKVSARDFSINWILILEILYSGKRHQPSGLISQNLGLTGWAVGTIGSGLTFASKFWQEFFWKSFKAQSSVYLFVSHNHCQSLWVSREHSQLGKVSLYIWSPVLQVWTQLLWYILVKSNLVNLETRCTAILPPYFECSL